MYVTELAWRNLWRNSRRTLLTLGAIAFATMVLTFFISIQLKSYSTAVRSTVSLFQGALQIQQREYLDKPQTRNSFPVKSELIDSLDRIPHVIGVAPRALGFALASSAERSYGVQVVGVSPERERRVSSISSRLVSGRYLGAGNEIVLGSALAKNLKVSIGDEVTLLGQGHDGSVAALVLSTVGIFESGARELDRQIVEIPIGAFDQGFSMEQQVHTIVLALDDLESLAPAAKVITGLLQPLYGQEVVLRDWEALLPGVRQSIELDMAGGWLFYSSLILIVTFCILNTFLMSVLERTRELGVILALGCRPYQLARLVLFESTLLSLCGALLGIFLGVCIVSYFHHFGFSIPGTEEIMKKWNLPGVIYPEVTWTVISIPVYAVAAASILSVVYPLVRVMTLDQLKALRS